MNKLNKKTVSLGGYSIVTTAIVIAIVIVINLAINALPSKYSKFSTSGIGMYDISDTSKNIASTVTDEIVIYLLVENGYEDDIVKEYVSRYCDLNSRLSFKTVDPAVQPGFASTYTDEQFSSLETNIIVVNNTNGRSRFIPNGSIYYRQYSDADLYMFQMYYGYTPDNPTYFDIEQQLTSAIDYVTTAHLPSVVYTSGHGEAAFVSESDNKIAALLDNENISLSELGGLTAAGALDKVDLVIINAPTKDFTAEEISALRSYADKSGNIILTSFYNTQAESRSLPNLHAFMKERGLEYADKLVFDKTNNIAGKYGNDPVLTPVAEGSFSTAIPSGTRIGLSKCHAIDLSKNTPEGITLTKLLTTSDEGYAKAIVDQNFKLEKVDGDEAGKFTLAAMSEKQTGSESSRVIWFASPDITATWTTSYFSNISYLLSIITDTCGKTEKVTIEAKSLQIEALTVSTSAANVWGTLLIAVIPAAFLLFGFVTWRRRTRA